MVVVIVVNGGGGESMGVVGGIDWVEVNCW